jgi:hypothetical protein
MPATRSDSNGRKQGRDFILAYQSRAGWLSDQSTSPAKSSAEKCPAAAKSASDNVLPASHLRVSASHPT